MTIDSEYPSVPITQLKEILQQHNWTLEKVLAHYNAERKTTLAQYTTSWPYNGVNFRSALMCDTHISVKRYETVLEMIGITT